MVEGPGATRNGRKVQPAVGLVLKELFIQQPCNGKIYSNSNSNSNSNSGSDKNNGNNNDNENAALATKFRLKGRRLESAFSVGKEVFLVLGPVLPPVHRDADTENTNTNEKQGSSICSDEIANKPMALRLHFGMNGCLAVRKQLLGSKSSITKPVLAPWQRKHDKSSSQKTQQTCTLRFVGGMEDEGAAPVVSSSTIVVIETAASTTCTVVSAAVAFSKLARLQNKDVCGTNFEPLAVLESILEKKRSASMVCDALLDQERFPGVGNIIKIEGLHRAGVHPRRLVETLSRDELLKTILECRNYARGWLSTGRAPSKKVYNQTHCLSCKNGRVKMVKMGNDLRRVTFWCERCQPLAVARSASTPRNDTSTKQESAANNNDNNYSNSNININNNIPEQPTMAALHPRRCCPQHGSKRVFLRRVRNKSSPNLHRLFRTCGVRGCQYFSWADTHLPSCGCHPRGSSSSKTVLKVSKTERTGGRWFLSCAATNGSSSSSRSTSSSFSVRNHHPYPTPKQFSKGCSFFQWATPGQLAPLANDLSPLT
jgi:formamidopyrimidine-DNA glycosylase